MHLREAPTTTLAEVREKIEDKQGEHKVLANHEIHLDLVDSHTIRLGDTELPSTIQGIDAIGVWAEVPSAFLKRLDADLQQSLLTSLLSRRGEAQAQAFYSEYGLDMVRDPSLRIIEPRQIVDVAAKVIHKDAPVVEFWSNPDEFRLDVIVPDGFDRGIGGDLKVDDITRGGIRIGQDTKRNLAPWVSEYMYRLWCTNGMERLDESLKVDARGQTVDEVLMELEVMADIAFKRVESSIASFYDLRNEKVDNPERTLLRMAEERGISSRAMVDMAEIVPTLTDGDVSMFDLVNLITNQANSPGLKAGPRRTLELAGGGIVGDHSDRCSHCQSVLGH